MDKKPQVKLLQKEMTRREFLQFGGSLVLVLFGLSNIIAHISRVKKIADDPTKIAQVDASHGFGSRKFGA
jgi:hypothetical protein